MATGRSKARSDEVLSAKALYERYAASLSQYLVRRVHRPEDVEDLTQEIFELFVRRKDRDQVVRNPLAYLFRIAFHVVGSALANEGRSPVLFGSQKSEQAEAESAAASIDAAEELAVSRDVQAALAQLPANHLAALMLVEGQGMSYKEAARVTGFMPSTVAAYVMHARAALKLALDGQSKRRTR